MLLMRLMFEELVVVWLLYWRDWPSLGFVSPIFLSILSHPTSDLGIFCIWKILTPNFHLVSKSCQFLIINGLSKSFNWCHWSDWCVLQFANYFSHDLVLRFYFNSDFLVLLFEKLKHEIFFLLQKPFYDLVIRLKSW